MTIQYAILGLLSWQSFSGYDLKKIISDSDVFYWSGNNNQIYRTLLQLNEEGLVTQAVQLQENLPAKKIYTITAAGRSALRDWLRTSPELPEIKNTFLTRLAWAEELNSQELDDLLENYAQEIATQLVAQKEKARRRASGRAGQSPGRSMREQFLWTKISDNLVGSYEHELAWVRGLQAELRKDDAA